MSRTSWFTDACRVHTFVVRLAFMFVLCGLAVAADAQAEKTANNSLYVELGGNGIMYSMNYDRMFAPAISGRVGLMLISATGTGSGSGTDRASLRVVPVMMNYLKGVKHKFEMGGGPVFVMASAEFEEVGSFSASGVGGTATFGYRYQPQGGGFNFRAGFTPIFGAGGFLPWGGLSLGYGF